MKNPILAFRKINSSQEQFKVNLGEYDFKKGIYNNSVNELKNNKEFTATLITKTREAADMSESS